MSVNGFDDSKNRKEVYTKEEVDSVKTKVITSSYNSNSGENKVVVTVRRSGNVVTVGVELTLQAGETGNYINFNDTIEIPDWAKPKRTYNSDKTANKIIAKVTSIGETNNGQCSGIVNNLGIWINPASGNCKLMGVFTNYAAELKTDVAILTYIVDNELPEENYQLGDINGDGEVNQEDLDLLNNYLLGYEGLSEKQKLLADVNKDGNIDSGDMFRLKQYIDGTIDSLE